MGLAEPILVAVPILSGVATLPFIHVTKSGVLMFSLKSITIGLATGFALTVPAFASIDSEPSCLFDGDTNTATISVTVDAASTLSSAAVIAVDGVAIAGAHSLSNSNKTVSVVIGQSCENQSAGQITVSDGSTTHQ